MPLRHRFLFWTLCLILAVTGYACDSDNNNGGGVQGPPVASLTITPNNPLPGEAVTIDASLSTDNGNIARYDIVIRDINGRIIQSFSGDNPTITLTFAAGAYSASVLLVDNDGNTTALTINFVVSNCGGAPVLDSTALTSGVEGVAYDFQIPVSGGVAPINVSLQPNGELPPGLSLASDGRITGTLLVPSAGTYLIPVIIEDSCDVAPRKFNATLTLTVIPATAGCDPLAITTTSLPAGNVNVPYNFTLTSSGGRLPVTFSLSGGTLPPGLNLLDNVISGTPTTASIYPFVLQAADSCPAGVQTRIQSYSLVVF